MRSDKIAKLAAALNTSPLVLWVGRTIRTFIPKKKLVLQAKNPKYEPFIYVGNELDEITILGKTVAFQSDVI